MAAEPTPAARGGNKLIGLQTGRGVAAGLVVITHAVDHPFPDSVDVIHLLGRYGVTLFFVISGFIMVYTTGKGSFDVRKFMWRRITRIVPIYYLATFIAAAGVLLVPAAFKNTYFDWEHIGKSLLFIPMYEPGPVGEITPFVKLGWTLNFEMFFYVAFAGLFFLGQNARAVVLTVFFGLLIAAGQIWDFDSAVLEYYTRIDTLGFVAGVWLGCLASGPGIRGRWMAWPLQAVSLVLVLYFWFNYADIKDNPWAQVMLVAAAAMQVAVLIMPLGWTSNAPRWAVFAGDGSYSMYLFHMFAVGAVTVLVRRFFPDMLFAAIPLSAIGGVVFGLCVYQFIEKPVNQWFKRQGGFRNPLVQGTTDSPAVQPNRVGKA